MCRVYWIEDREREGGEDRGRKERQGNKWAVCQTESTTDCNKVTPLHQFSKISSLERERVCVCDGGEGREREAWELSYSY